jgi:hypothetical protein
MTWPKGRQRLQTVVIELRRRSSGDTQLAMRQQGGQQNKPLLMRKAAS